MRKSYTQYEAEILCQSAHRKLGIKEAKCTATKTDRMEADRAAKRLAKFFPLVT